MRVQHAKSVDWLCGFCGSEVPASYNHKCAEYDRSAEGPEYVACPLCKQYSHSLADDEVAGRRAGRGSIAAGERRCHPGAARFGLRWQTGGEKVCHLFNRGRGVRRLDLRRVLHFRGWAMRRIEQMTKAELGAEITRFRRLLNPVWMQLVYAAMGERERPKETDAIFSHMGGGGSDWSTFGEFYALMGDPWEAAASADTRPQGGDAQQAPFTSGAVGEAETPNPDRTSHGEME